MNLSVYVTCHDVMPHVNAINERRIKIFTIADRLIVHSDYSMKMLRNLLPDKSAVKKIVKYPFPFSSYDEIVTEERLKRARLKLKKDIAGIDNKSYILFIGVVRRSKGIEMLLEAWKRLEFSDECSLVIAGKWADIDEIKVEASGLPNCIIIDKYLSDEEFVILIKNAKFTVLPYLDYAHSSIVISCLRLDCIIVLSDIDLFKEILPSYPLMFMKGDINQLIFIMNKALNMSGNDLLKIRNSNKDIIGNYDKLLAEGIQSAFNKSYNKNAML